MLQYRTLFAALTTHIDEVITLCLNQVFYLSNFRRQTMSLVWPSASHMYPEKQQPPQKHDFAATSLCSSKTLVHGKYKYGRVRRDEYLGCRVCLRESYPFCHGRVCIDVQLIGTASRHNYSNSYICTLIRWKVTVVGMTESQPVHPALTPVSMNAARTEEPHAEGSNRDVNGGTGNSLKNRRGCTKIAKTMTVLVS